MAFISAALAGALILVFADRLGYTDVFTFVEPAEQ